MKDREDGVDEEFAAIQTVFRALEPLDADSRQRVFEYIAARLAIVAASVAASTPLSGDERSESPGELGKASAQRKFATLADLVDAADPKTNIDRVLVAAYWVQVCEGAESFNSYSVNHALKDLGHGVSNVTGAFDALKGQKPALVLQLRKAGTSKQARKTYKVTNAGVEAVKGMLHG